MMCESIVSPFRGLLIVKLLIALIESMGSWVFVGEIEKIKQRIIAEHDSFKLLEPTFRIESIDFIKAVSVANTVQTRLEDINDMVEDGTEEERQKFIDDDEDEEEVTAPTTHHLEPTESKS